MGIDEYCFPNIHVHKIIPVVSIAVHQALAVTGTVARHHSPMAKNHPTAVSLYVQDGGNWSKQVVLYYQTEPMVQSSETAKASPSIKN